jgi:hypothetical protein
MQPTLRVVIHLSSTAAYRIRPYWCCSWRHCRSVVRYHFAKKRQMPSQCSEALISVATLRNTNCLPMGKACTPFGGIAFHVGYKGVPYEQSPSTARGKRFLSRYDRYQKSVSTKRRARSLRADWSEHNLRYHAALRRI